MTNFYRGVSLDFEEGSITISGLFLFKGNDVKVLKEGEDYIIKGSVVEFIKPLNMQDNDSIATEFSIKADVEVTIDDAIKDTKGEEK